MSCAILQATKDTPKVNEWAVMNGIKNLEEAYNNIKGSMAMHFPFELDKFQKEAICNLELVWHWNIRSKLRP